MDEIGLRELIRTGVKTADETWTAARATAESYPAQADTDLAVILDRFVQIGLIALEHSVKSLWSEMLAGLLDIYRLGLPKDLDTWTPPAGATRYLVDVTHRVMALGAVARRLKKYDYLRTLALQFPIETRNDNWIRYTVTQASRGELKEAFKGKSLIGPAAEYVRGNSQLVGLFDENQDVVVNSICQFDFLNCVIVVTESQDIDSCYPNFGGYYEHRTLPIVYDLIRGGSSRSALPDTLSDNQLSVILKALDETTRHAFFDISGWHGYDTEISQFIAEHSADT